MPLSRPPPRCRTHVRHLRNSSGDDCGTLEVAEINYRPQTSRHQLAAEWCLRQWKAKHYIFRSLSSYLRHPSYLRFRTLSSAFIFHIRCSPSVIYSRRNAILRNTASLCCAAAAMRSDFTKINLRFERFTQQTIHQSISRYAL